MLKHGFDSFRNPLCELRLSLGWPMADEIRLRYRLFRSDNGAPLTGFITRYCPSMDAARAWIRDMAVLLELDAARDFTMHGDIHQWDDSPRYIGEFTALNNNTK